MKATTALDDNMKKGVMYEVPCGEYSKVYTGETGRNLKERMMEHKYAVKKKNMNNGIVAYFGNRNMTLIGTQLEWRPASSICGKRRSWRHCTLNEQGIHPTWTVVYSSTLCGPLHQQEMLGHQCLHLPSFPFSFSFFFFFLYYHSIILFNLILFFNFNNLLLFYFYFTFILFYFIFILFLFWINFIIIFYSPLLSFFSPHPFFLIHDHYYPFILQLCFHLNHSAADEGLQVESFCLSFVCVTKIWLTLSKHTFCFWKLLAAWWTTSSAYAYHIYTFKAKCMWYLCTSYLPRECRKDWRAASDERHCHQQCIHLDRHNHLDKCTSLFAALHSSLLPLIVYEGLGFALFISGGLCGLCLHFYLTAWLPPVVFQKEWGIPWCALAWTWKHLSLH